MGWTNDTDNFKDEQLGVGVHEIPFVPKNWKVKGNLQLCSVEVLEYETEEQYLVLSFHLVFRDHRM